MQPWCIQWRYFYVNMYFWRWFWRVVIYAGIADKFFSLGSGLMINAVCTCFIVIVWNQTIEPYRFFVIIVGMFLRPLIINGNTIWVNSMSGGFNADLLPDIDLTGEPANEPIDTDNDSGTDQDKDQHR